MFCDWIERKIEARMQNRVGPTTAGYAGILQPWADIIKLLTKESPTPQSASKTIFKITPIIAYSLLVFALFFMPIDGANVIPGSDFEGDLILVLVLISIANFFLFLAGWASNNPYSKVGGARVILQILGYDIPLFLLAMAPAMLANQLDITNIVASQAQHLPFALLIPWVFVVFLLAMQAELEKDPFDIPHAETEVVGGYETEYSGASLAILKLCKDVQIVYGAFLITELFLGGPNGPVFFGLTAFWATFWFVLKVIIIVIVTEYITGIFARMRIDQVMTLNWRVIMPLAIISFIFAIFVAMGINGVVI